MRGERIHCEVRFRQGPDRRGGGAFESQAVFHSARHRTHPDKLQQHRRKRCRIYPGAIGDRLTSREREIVQLLSEGKSSKEVASVLSISVKTAETHRANIMRKLEIHSVSELVRYAVRNQIIEP